ncbi:MAG: DUF512 domain-containing protein [Chloroflexi bacterium]|nr:DUF512 domain-containing protein [Chloroflexota bacterium]
MARERFFDVAAVHPLSPADLAGVRPGDVLLGVDGQAVRDVLDYQFLTAGGGVWLDVRRGEATVRLRAEKAVGEELGLAFAALTADGIRTCGNKCPFCFVTQQPRRMRRTLYIKDDDLRYSFAHGAFITMSNWTEDDWRRVAEQRLSPMYVSVHATDDQVRRRLLGNASAPSILAQLRRLGELRIQAHAQLVVCPGWNDGPVLDRSIADLRALYPVVRSVSVVPVGLTKYRAPSDGVRPHTLDELRATHEQARAAQRRLRAELGFDFAYVSDEVYLRLGERPPGAARYDGYPVYENGVGMVRSLLDGWARARRRLPPALPRSARLLLVCGELPAPLLERAARDLAQVDGLEPRLVVVPNTFYGGNVGCSGLLVGAEVLAALRGYGPADAVLLPRRMFDPPGQVTLDDYTLADFQHELGAPVLLAETAGDLAAAVRCLA